MPPPPPRTLIFASLERSSADLADRAIFGSSVEGGWQLFSRASSMAMLEKVLWLGLVFWSQLTGLIFFCPPPQGGTGPKVCFLKTFELDLFKEAKIRT